MGVRSLSILLALVLGAAASGQEAAGIARGFVRALDTDNGTVTLSLVTGKSKVEHRLKTFNLLKPDIPVQNMAGLALKMRDVEEDALVTLKLNAEDDVIAIVTSLPLIHGFLWRIDPKDRVLIVKTPIGEKTVAVPLDAKVYYGSNSVKLEDLKSTGTISVVLAEDRKKAIEIRMGKGVVALPKPLKSMGTLIDVDRDKQSARVFASKSMGDWHVLHEIPLSRGVTFTLMFVGKPLREIPLRDVAGPLSGTYWTESATSKLVHFDLEMPVLNQRTVKAIDLENRMLTIREGEGDKTYALAAHVKIINRTGKVVEARPGSVVSFGLHPDRKHVEIIVVSGK